jgi:hypothetical protein
MQRRMSLTHLPFRVLVAVFAASCTASAATSFAAAVPGERREAVILVPRDIQETASGSGNSPFFGETVSVVGVVTASSPLGRLYYIAGPEGGEWSGLKVEGPSLERRVGEKVFVRGVVAELFGETRLLQTSVSFQGDGVLPPPAEVSLAALRDDGERWEGVLVRSPSLTVESFTDRFGEFLVADSTASDVVVDDEFFTSYIGDPGDTFVALTGVVSYGFGSFRLEPRDDADLEGWVSGRGFAGRLPVTVVDEDGAPLPAKVTLFPQSGFSLDLGPDDRAEGSMDVAYLAHGRGIIALPFGVYEIVVSRGFEYGLWRQRVTVGTGPSGEIRATLRREVDSAGWLSADFHLHCAPSFDTALPVPGRIVSLVGEGVEWAVSTDHNEITDYSPEISRLGLGRWITS